MWRSYFFDPRIVPLLLVGAGPRRDERLRQHDHLWRGAAPRAFSRDAGGLGAWPGPDVAMVEPAQARESARLDACGLNRAIPHSSKRGLPADLSRYGSPCASGRACSIRDWQRDGERSIMVTRSGRFVGSSTFRIMGFLAACGCVSACGLEAQGPGSRGRGHARPVAADDAGADRKRLSPGNGGGDSRRAGCEGRHSWPRERGGRGSSLAAHGCSGRERCSSPARRPPSIASSACG